MGNTFFEGMNRLDAASAFGRGGRGLALGTAVDGAGAVVAEALDVEVTGIGSPA